ncbi:TIGR02234 family membrane protein [Nocardia sp. NBC_01730]|uniref:TIGR02234 family membrane protein n=1 Tax=Nocardia sp. NBC_01730 TaxID=2975998 RepID=UPI002E1571A2|nr:TIGR02234 family membrane protein [Nocardia sp. NBC_01730]
MTAVPDGEPGTAREHATEVNAEAGRASVPPPHGSGAAASAHTGSRRRYPVGTVVLLALAAAALWGSSRMTWVTLTSSDGLTQPRTDHLNGGVWFGVLTPMALVLLASIAAVLATRGWLRRVIGVLITLVAAVTAVPAFALLTNSGKIAERAAKLAELPARAQVGEVTPTVFPAALALLGAIAAFVAGALLTRMPAETGRLSGKYDNPVFRRAAATAEVTQRRAETADPEPPPQLSERVLWDALDAGTDPTEESAPPGDPDSGKAGRHER